MAPFCLKLILVEGIVLRHIERKLGDLDKHREALEYYGRSRFVARDGAGYTSAPKAVSSSQLRDVNGADRNCDHNRSQLYC